MEVDGEVAYLEQAHERFIIASSASRSPSPNRLMARTVLRLARPGKVTTHQARVMNSRASASMAPHSGVGGCAPWPRNPSAAAPRIAVEKLSVACTTRCAIQLGSPITNLKTGPRAPSPPAEAPCTTPT